MSSRARCAVVSVMVVLALVATACSSTPDRRASGGTAGDPTTLPALPGTDGLGERVPVWTGAVLTPTSWVSSSLTPTLSVPGATGAWTFTITDLSDGKSEFGTKTYAESGSTSRVPLGAGLQQGNAYVWTATSPGQQPVGGSFAVDVQMVGVQQVDSIGGVDAALSSGEASVSWSSHAMGAVSGSVGLGLTFRASNPDEVGLPVGWSLKAASNFPYTRLELWSPTTVALIGSDGQVVNYRTGPGGALVPVQTGDGIDVTGLAPVVLRNVDGTFSVITKAATATFTPDGDRAYLTSIDGGTDPVLSQSWTSGRLQSVGDPVSGRKITFVYGGGDCPKPTAGFVPAPAGMLCRVKFWDGSTSAFLYVDTVTGPTIGRLIDFPEAKGDGAQVLDLAYDAAGRVARTRTPLVAAAASSGVIAIDDEQFWNAVTYGPDGRVATMTQAASSAGATRCVRTHEHEGSLVRVSDSCFGGPIASITFDPTTFFTLRSIDSAGRTAVNEWDLATGQLLRTTDVTGLTTVNRYEGGELVQKWGPTRGSITDSMSILNEYDQTFSAGPEGTDMHGLDVTYWPGAGATPSGAVQQLGPRIGDALASSLTINWTTSPAQKGDAWSGLMTGTLEVATAGEYRIVSGNTTARVRVNNVLCVDGGCDRLPLRVGANPIRIDLSSSTAAASMDVSWSGPDTGGISTSIPTRVLRPAYGYVTTTKATDPTVRAAVATNISRSSYDEPATGRITSRTNQAGSTSRFGYASSGRSGATRQTEVTDASGARWRYSYWGDTESATAPCPGATAANQAGAARDTLLPGADGGDGPVFTSQWVDAAGRSVAVRSVGGAVECTTFGPAGDVVSVVVLGMGSTQRIDNTRAVDGNPLVKSTTETDGDRVTTTIAEIDLAGRLVRSVDRFGIITNWTYDDRSGQVATVTTAAPGATPVVVRNSYDGVGRLSSTTVNGRVVATPTYTPEGLIASVAYGNGVSVDANYDLQNALVGLTWRTAAGVYANTREVSAGGTTMSTTFSTPSASSRFEWSHDDNGRLSGASVTAGVVPVDRTWAWTYDAASNRTSQRVTDAGVVTGDWTYTYDRASRLLTTTDPAAAGGGLDYDGSGNATKVGPDSFVYDAANRVLSATDGAVTVTYDRAVDGTIVSRTVTGGPGAGTIAYGDNGVLLDGQGRAYAKQINLAMGVTWTMSLAAASAGRWQFTALDGDRFLLTDESGGLVGGPQVYDAFGNALTAPDPASPTLPSTTWEAATGNETEALRTPYQLMGARVYLPMLGRFVQLDPKIGGSANSYDYVNQDPVDYNDPSGNESDNWLITGLAAVAATAASALLAPARGFLVGAVVGAVAGAVVAGVATGIEYAATGDTSFSVARFGLSILTGAVAGGIAGRVKWAKAAGGAKVYTSAHVAGANLEFLGGSPRTINANIGWVKANAALVNEATAGYRTLGLSTDGMIEKAKLSFFRAQVDGVTPARHLLSDPTFGKVVGSEGLSRFGLYHQAMLDREGEFFAFLASKAS